MVLCMNISWCHEGTEVRHDLWCHLDGVPLQDGFLLNSLEVEFLLFWENAAFFFFFLFKLPLQHEYRILAGAMTYATVAAMLDL